MPWRKILQGMFKFETDKRQWADRRKSRKQGLHKWRCYEEV
jgi:hypothetical protein